jgi:DHA1 family solute carrier family 18 vesicular amine transporter 1/2
LSYMPPDVPPQMRKNFNIMIASTIVMMITSSTIYMVLPLFFASVGLSNADNGILISIGTFAGVISGLIAGALSNRFGRKNILILSGFIYSSTFFMLVFMGHDFTSLMISRFIAGIGFYMMPVMVTTMAADIFPMRERGRAMALYGVAGGIGALIGPLITPFLVFGNDYTWYFLFSAISILLSSIAMIFLVKETLPEEIKLKSMGSMGRAIDVQGFFISVKGLGVVVAIFLVAVLLYRTGYTMIDPFLSLYLSEVLHLNLDSVSYIFALRAMCTIIFSQASGWLTDKYGRKTMFLIGLVMTVMTTFSYTITTTFFQMLFLRAFDAAATAITLTAIRTLIADLLSPEMRAFGMGLHSAITQQSSTVGSIFSGFIIDAFGFNTTFYLATILCFLALIIVQIWIPEPGKTKMGKVESPIKT